MFSVNGEEQAGTKVSYFKGNDPAKWENNIPTYDLVNLGEVYEGIDLRLKAYGNNIEKLFTVKPGYNPDLIKACLNGARSLKVNGEGQLEAETVFGPVKFTKPIAYQKIDGKRVEVNVEYCIQKRDGKGVVGNPKTANSRKTRTNKFVHATHAGNQKSAIRNTKSEYGFKVATYDKTKDLIIDPLLASTFLGDSSGDYATSMTMDKSGNIYVTGWTWSSDVPTTTGVYNTSFNGDIEDAYVVSERKLSFL